MKQDVQRYLTRVRFLRLLLPITAGLLLTVSLLSPLLQWEKEISSIFSIAGIKLKVSNEMANPNYYAFDRKGRPYEVRAATAHQKNDHQVDMVAPQGTLQHTSENQVRVTAKTGEYDQKKNTLILNKDVHLQQNQGYDLISEEATVYLDTNRIEGKKGVSGIGPEGTLKGEAFAVYNDGKNLLLKGKSQIIFMLKKRTSESS